MESNLPTKNIHNQFVRGWTWGSFKLETNSIDFENNQQPWFSIPNNAILNVLLPTKNELGIEFNVDEDLEE